MAIAVAEFVEHEVRVRTVRAEQDTIAGGVRAQRIVDAEVDRSARRRSEFDEGRHVRAAVHVYVELVGPVKSEMLIV